MKEDQVRAAIEASLQELFRLDPQLLEIDAAERAIAARLACHMSSQFSGHNVDVEYNRHGLDPKRVSLPIACGRGEPTLVVPDIVVHQRGNDARNLLVVEVKKETSPNRRDHDRAKIEAIKREYHYEFGLLLSLPAGPSWTDRTPGLEWV